MSEIYSSPAPAVPHSPHPSLLRDVHGALSTRSSPHAFASPSLGVYSPRATSSLPPTPRATQHPQHEHVPASLPSPGLFPHYSPPVLPVLLHPELTSHCSLSWNVFLSPTTARSRFHTPYPFELDLFGAPACPGASRINVQIIGGSVVGAWMDQWGPIPVVLHSNSCQITIVDLLTEIYAYLHTRLSPQETTYIRHRDIVEAARGIRVNVEGATTPGEWDLPPKRVDVVAPGTGCDFVSLKSYGIGSTGAVELSLRLAWLG
ncbi:hypothetical protein V5O48_006130 [Marasmius crinis-equi]|uniref:DUF6699 domain-containing protein n=1 Tax=Marasmius crinis-equi TaxID=585013 RepID=A0ABR3FKC1_9AGAR